MIEIESKELRSCADCMVGQGRGCRCSHVDPLPSQRALIAVAVAAVVCAPAVVVAVARLAGWLS